MTTIETDNEIFISKESFGQRLYEITENPKGKDLKSVKMTNKN